jgi:phosphopantothenoylcysteine decarboxylase/phosphopantothenate--cysteine ligase
LGISLAREFLKQGARVKLILGPVNEKIKISGLKIIPVVSADEMFAAVKNELKNVDTFIATAAVSDYRFLKFQKEKVKKTSASTIQVTLKKNPDILAYAGQWKGRKKKPLVVGYALETRHVRDSAEKKLKDKNLDLIIGNDKTSFGGATIKPLWAERGNKFIQLPKMKKDKLSQKIVRWAVGKINE